MFSTTTKFGARPGFDVWERWKRRTDAATAQVLGNLAPSVTGGLIAAGNLTAPVPAPLYLDKTFIKPAYICQDGKVNIDLVDKTIEQIPARLEQLLEKEVTKVPLDTTNPAPLGEAIEAKKEELKAEVSVPQDAPKLQSAVMPLVSDVWNAVEPLNYHAQIQVGTSPVPFYVDLDTGSSLLWLQAKVGQSDDNIPDQSMYTPRKSTTAKDLQSQRQMSYGDGARVLCQLFNDSVNAGGLLAEQQLLGAAPEENIRDENRSKKANGLLGLGFAKNTLNLVETLKAQGRVKHASLSLIGPRNDPKLAAKIDKNLIMQPRGYFVIGSVDPKFYTGEIAWCPQLSPDRWIVRLDAVVINGVTAFTNQRALIDTGNAYITVSPSIFTRVQTFIPGSRQDPKKGLRFAFPQDSLQSIEFVFGGRSLHLNRQDFVIGNWSVGSGKSGYLSSIQRSPEWPDGFDDLWVMGGMFLDNIVTIFDYDDRRVGFADISESSLEDGR